MKPTDTKNTSNKKWNQIILNVRFEIYTVNEDSSGGFFDAWRAAVVTQRFDAFKAMSPEQVRLTTK